MFEDKIKQIVGNLLPEGKYNVFLFGSRVSGKNLKWSDYDIGVLGDKPLPLDKKAEIVEALEESDIPYLVEVVDFSRVSDKFKAIALANKKDLIYAKN